LISVSVFCLILTILEIIFLTRRKLTPLKFIIVSVIKSLIWTAVVIVDIVTAAKTSAGEPGFIGGIIVEVGIV